ncbi:pirin family protein [Actinotalea sp. K2]|uniref:pirin family protein n=1 Tax=Actinotalea sp. K2 TaxID=2939438 RepID=UPI002016D5E2|nr:pirin family protein [Actinotalea sp. K2]MCL3861684.1 pirin family protein [Actinotalea sp. K2]
MTNLETAPTELVCDDAERVPAPEVLLPREVPLGGIRAMSVRRTLPQRRRSFIGAWCFVDHYGPDDVAVTGGMRVPPHPHTGLQTVSWLFSGQIEHRDSLGTHALVRPGELNLMTAGRGISHSEDSTADTAVLHGVQLWLALPEKDRGALPAFESYVPPVQPLPAGEVRVFLGSLAGSTSPVGTFSPLVGAEVRLRAGHEQVLVLDARFEHGFLVDTGGLEVGGVSADRGELLYLPVGTTTVTVRAAGDADLRVVLLGGVPLGERIVMWWNFIGSSHEQVEQARAAWQAEIGAPDAIAVGGGSRFGQVVGHPAPALPAPVLPHHRLLPRA